VPAWDVVAASFLALARCWPTEVEARDGPQHVNAPNDRTALFDRLQSCPLAGACRIPTPAGSRPPGCCGCNPKSKPRLWQDAAHAPVEVHRDRWVIFMVPVQFFQSVIAVELAIVGALLWQIRFFDKEDTQAETSRKDPWLQLLLLVVLTAILFGSLEALREGGGQLAAVLLTVGLAVSLLPILLRVLRPVRRDATMEPRDPQLWVTLLGLIFFAAVVALLMLIG
jgi:hypothetical protein